MTPLMAKLVAVASVLLLLGALGILLVGSNPDVRGGTEVTAKFEDAYPIQEGNHVRVSGAVAGEVTEVELGSDGEANVTMRLFEGTQEPRRDAVASIRQEDITGDSYLSLSPGHSPEPLGDEPIGRRRTLTAPRLDDLLNAFDKPVRQGLKLTLVELGRTLEGRGEDVNTAALELRPGLRAANRALGEVRSQNRALRALIGDAQRVTSQAADRSGELSRLIESLATTVRTTSDHSAGLNRALERAPESTRAAHGTLSRLTRLGTSAQPLAVRLNRMAPQLVRAIELLGPFADDARAILADVEPTLEDTTELLRASVPTLEANPQRAFTAPFDLTAANAGVLDALLGNPESLRSLFSARCYGGRRCDSRGDFGLGAIAVEGGNQTGFPANYDKERFMVRAVAIPSCETFGVPNREGCLDEVLTRLDRVIGNFGGAATTSRPRTAPTAPQGAPAPRRGRGGAPEARPPSDRGGLLGGALDRTLERLDAAPPRASRGGRTPSKVIDYLLGP